MSAAFAVRRLPSLPPALVSFDLALSLLLLPVGISLPTASG
jgi:hypothetical protein